ncbi:EAL domain-containing protein [Pseudomonas sp. NPDC007930]|uniref:putative bifunctional diguanylate cyclase/phosphodiesterase n=1 Tax=Pseudomonas sp. NPDC007930 TaxID=3364417 RepID=UPI0036E31166
MFKPAFTRWAARGRSRQLILRLLPAIAALSALIGLGCFLLVKNALSQDADVQQRSRTFIARTLDQVCNEVGRNIVNYAKWGEAYQHLHVVVDKDWADVQRNVGDVPYQLYGYNGVLVLDAQDRTVYAVIDGQPATLQAGDWLQGDLPGLVAAARASDSEEYGVVRAFRVGGTPALVAAATITPGAAHVALTPGAASVMMFVNVLDPTKLGHLSDTYGLPPLSVAHNALPGQDALPLAASNILLNWHPPRPGRHLLKQTLPLFMAAVLALAGVLTVLLRYAILSARQLDAQFSEVQQLSLHDSLTGLPNRHQLHQQLAALLAQGQPLALLSLDLDRFKPINDALGHAVGDQVLQTVAQRLRGAAPAGASVARLGGDEFVLLVPGPCAEAALASLAQPLIDALCQPLAVAGQVLFIGTSVGIALAPAHAAEAAELLRLADIALYQAKAAGRNTWRLYHERMNQALLARQQLEHELRRALAEGELRVHYQPRYATASGQVCGAEALVRWQHPRHGLLYPGRFLGLAEECGLIQPLGHWVLQQACAEAAGWPAAMKVSVNLAPAQFSAPARLAEGVAAVLASSGLAPARLELEFTEQALLEHRDSALATLQQLKALGVRLSLDNFGSGFSSLAYLRHYPLDGIKIDRSFIAGLAQEAGDQAVVRSMIDLGRSLGITVTAEGIETAQQLACLRLHRCDEVLGFHFSEALPAEGLLGVMGRA